MKPIVSFPGVTRRGLLATLATLPVLSAPLLPVSASAQTATSTDPLPSWNDGPAKQAIIDFVGATTDRASPNYVPIEERIATFDQDGTLWVEHPMYTQVVYCLERVPAVVKEKPELAKVEPFKTVLSGDREAMAKLSFKDLERILAATLTGMSVEEFKAEVTKWLETARHPRWNRLYTGLAYLPKTFIAEARKYQVFPLDASVAARIVAPRPNITAGRSEFVYTRPMVGLPQGDSPLLLNTSYTVTADIDVPQGGAQGMILTSGGRFAGYGFYMLNGKPVWLWNMVDLERLKWEGPDALTPGRHIVEFEFKYDGLGVGTLAFNNFSGVGRPGTGTLKVDGKVVATKTMDKTLPMILQWDESFDIGSDTLTGVNDADYKPPFPLTAKLNKLMIKLDRPQLSPEDMKKLEAAMKKKD